MADFRDEGIFSPDQIAALEAWDEKKKANPEPYDDAMAEYYRVRYGGWDGRVVSKPDHARDNRIEALRAASRVVAGMPEYDMDGPAPPGQADYVSTTLNLAEQFAHWLETGER